MVYKRFYVLDREYDLRYTLTLYMKKKISSATWTMIQPLIDKYQEYFTIEETNEYTFFLKGKDKTADFYFQCSKQSPNGTFSVVYRPAGENLIKMITFYQVEIQLLVEHLSDWVKILKIYEDNTLKAKRNARFLKQYEQAYYKDLILHEEDADSSPFDNKRQLLLYDYLTEVKSLLDDVSSNTDNKLKKEALQAIYEDCEKLQTTLITLTKNEVLRQLGHIWARTHLYSLPLLKDVIVKFSEGTTGFLGKKTIEFSSILDIFKELF